MTTEARCAEALFCDGHTSHYSMHRALLKTASFPHNAPANIASTCVSLRNDSSTDNQYDTKSIRLCYFRWTPFGGGRQVSTMGSTCLARHQAWSTIDGC